MKLSPRAKLLLLALLFLAPIVASTIAYLTVKPAPTANYGELLMPGPTPAVPLLRPDGTDFGFGQLRGRWVLAVVDGGVCRPSCFKKLDTIRQVRLAMGRNASRVERLMVVDDGHLLPEIELGYPGMVVATLPKGWKASGFIADRGHIYLIDPNGNVMMRWPADPDGKRMIRDLERLLKASQIG